MSEKQNRIVLCLYFCIKIKSITLWPLEKKGVCGDVRGVFWGGRGWSGQTVNQQEEADSGWPFQVRGHLKQRSFDKSISKFDIMIFNTT